MKPYSSAWKSSKNPGKQRQYRRNAPLHTRRKLLSCNLSKPLRLKFKRRNVVLRTGDKVKVLRGRFKGKEGTVRGVDLKRMKVSVTGIELTKRDGTKVFPMIDPSNLQITELKLDDKLRKKAIERSAA